MRRFKHFQASTAVSYRPCYYTKPRPLVMVSTCAPRKYSARVHLQILFRIRLDGIVHFRLKAGFHLCDCGRATRVIDRKQSREPVARLRDQWLEHAYQVIIVESKQSDWLCPRRVSACANVVAPSRDQSSGHA